jgi:methyl-accepting chemotaxis protein
MRDNQLWVASMKSMIANLRIRSRLILGFGIVCLILAASIGITILKVGDGNAVTQRTIDVRVPTALAGDKVVGRIYGSLAALRGWMLTGNPAFKDERAAIWRNIDASVAEIDALSTDWTDPKNKAAWAEAKTELGEFRVAQAKVEAIANTIDQLPASKILVKEAAPFGAAMIEQITAMINDESQQPSSDERKKLLLAMADVRGSAAMSLASIRAYLLSGDAKFKADFDKFWGVNEKRFGDLTASGALFSPAQAAAFDKLAAARKGFAPLPAKMFEIRSSDGWDVAQKLLITEAAPRAGKLLDVLNGERDSSGDRNGGLTGSQEVLLHQEANSVIAGNEFLQTLLWVMLGVGLGTAVAVVLLTTHTIVPPIQAITNVMTRLTEGEHRVAVPGVDRGDELGHMAKSVLVFKDNMVKAKELAEQEIVAQRQREARARAIEELTSRFDADVMAVLKTVASAATELQSTAGSMTQTAEQMTDRSTAVASASTQASANVQTVASAAEELSSSVSEITRQVSRSSEIAGRAVNESQRTNEQVKGLAEAADKIGAVVQLISTIAGQTNLLALNATIEAARAGEAGKGFAVVASEVKSLANQTAKATEEITSHISGIQSATQHSVAAIQGIAGTIGEINEIAATIASAVEEQGAATQEIARNVQEAATGTAEVSSNISGVTEAAATTSAAAEQVLGAAGELSKQSELLRTKVETFLAEVKAA